MIKGCKLKCLLKEKICWSEASGIKIYVKYKKGEQTSKISS